MTMTIEPQEGCQPWAFPSMCRSGVLVLECWKMVGIGVDAGNLDGGSVGTEGEDQPWAWWRVQASIGVCFLHLPPWVGARLAERGRGMPYDRPCGVSGTEGWLAKIKVVQEVLEGWLVLADEVNTDDRGLTDLLASVLASLSGKVKYIAQRER